MTFNIKKIFHKNLNRIIEDQDFKYIFKNSRYNVFLQILGFTTGFFITWCFANFTPTEFYGSYLFILSISNFFFFLSISGITESLTQSVSKGNDYFLKTALKYKFIYSQTGTVSIFLFGLYYAFFIEFNLIIISCILIIAFFFSFKNTLDLYQYFLFGKEQFKKNFYYSVLISAITNLLIIVLIFVTRNLILHFLLLYTLTIIAQIFFIKTCLKLIEKESADPLLDQKSIKYGLSLTKYSTIHFLVLNLNNIVIGIVFGATTLVFYTIGKGLITLLIRFIKPILSSLLAKYSKKDAFISKKFFIFIIITSIIIFLGTIMGLPLFLLIFFPTYLHTIGYGIAYASLLLIYPILVVLSYYFRGKANKNVLQKGAFYPAIIDLILIIPLTIYFGLYGLILNDIIFHFSRLIIYLKHWKEIKIA